MFTPLLRALPALAVCIALVFGALLAVASVSGQENSSNAAETAAVANSAATMVFGDIIDAAADSGQFAAVPIHKRRRVDITYVAMSAAPVSLTEAVPQGTNPDTLVLDLDRTPRMGGERVYEGRESFPNRGYHRVLIRDAATGENLEIRICQPDDTDAYDWRAMAWIDQRGKLRTHCRVGGHCWAYFAEGTPDGCDYVLHKAPRYCHRVARARAYAADNDAPEVTIEDRQGGFCGIVTVVRPLAKD